MAFVTAGNPVAAVPAGRVLTVEDRVAAQRAIERVYWNHRLWPNENPGPKPSFSEVVSDDTIRGRVEDYLRKSDALEEIWRSPIGSKQLQAEMDRMAANTRDPATLSELFNALGNDPLLIAETLARPTLVDRLVRERYAQDRGLHAGERQRAQAARRACQTVECMTSMGGEYHEATWTGKKELWRLADLVGGTVDALHRGTLSDAVEERDAIVVTAVLTQSESTVTTATVSWPKVSFDSWWDIEKRRLATQVQVASGPLHVPAMRPNACVSDTWTPTFSDVPDPRYDHTAIWTGAEMIVWGGETYSGNSGGRYNPSTDSWMPTSRGLNVPVPRTMFSAVWTGSEMIVWGGSSANGLLNSGGRYDPISDTWLPTSTGANVPSGRGLHTAVWTGTEMIIWGGGDQSGWPNTGGRYNPSMDSWLPTSTAGSAPPGRTYHTAVWTGTQMIVWGGNDASEGIDGRYDPSTDSWAPVASQPTLSRLYHSAVWTGTEMIVWGGYGPSETGARYDPVANTWSQLPTGGNAPAPRQHHTAVWTGTEMIVWGGEGGGLLKSGGRYSPSSNSWLPTSTAQGVPDGRQIHTAVWTGAEMIVWGGLGSASLNNGGRYSPSTDTWAPTSTATTIPVPRGEHTAVWTGSEMIVWGGTGYAGVLNSGGRYDPALDNWRPTSTLANVPIARHSHTAVWTGSEMIVWGGRMDGATALNSGARYDPSSDTWISTSAGAGLPQARSMHTAVWTGSEMIVWGGKYLAGQGGFLNSGGRYAPTTDSWISTATGPSVPSPRYGHTAVWTGTEMIVWAGTDSPGSSVNSGGRYSPTADSWMPTSTGAGVPASRQSHTAVWTGADMIVWGGRFDSTSRFNTGGRYNPATDVWLPISTGANVPSERFEHSAVWTGNDMILWGGEANETTSTGGRYDPKFDTWSPTSTGPNVPGATSQHTAVETGTQMIIWGGSSSTGGVYCTCPAGRFVFRDVDGDGYGNNAIAVPTCDGLAPQGFVADNRDCADADAFVHPGAAEICNGVDDDCNGQIDEDHTGTDSDGDGVENVCDNCAFDWNAAQSDFDHDGQGDICDLNDGLIYVYSTNRDHREWQVETGYTQWNSYRGSLAALRSTGQYTQAPGSNPLAAHDCGLSDAHVFDPVVPSPGAVAFGLVTGVAGGVETGLGTNSAGAPRPNANPCP